MTSCDFAKAHNYRTGYGPIDDLPPDLADRNPHTGDPDPTYIDSEREVERALDDERGTVYVIDWPRQETLHVYVIESGEGAGIPAWYKRHYRVEFGSPQLGPVLIVSEILDPTVADWISGRPAA